MTTKFPTAVLHADIEINKKEISKLKAHDGVQDERITGLRDDVNEVCKIADELQKVVIKSGVAISVGTWIVAAFGISVIALIWSLITGQAHLVF